MNEHDSERMKGMLESLGYREVPERADADEAVGRGRWRHADRVRLRPLPLALVAGGGDDQAAVDTIAALVEQDLDA